MLLFIPARKSDGAHMLTALIDWARLIGAAWRLTRYDALIPREVAHQAPPLIKFIGAATRIGANTKRDGRKLRPGERLAAAFEAMSPPYVKLGQVMATRPDVIGFEMAEDLGRLQDAMPAFPRAHAVAELETAFGKPLSELFDTFSEPIAAASIAQVHKATLKDGREVAVKILRPKIEQRARREFRAFLRAAKTAEMLSRPARRLEPVKFIETLRESAAVELDLRMEAGAASQLAEDMHGDPQIVIPEIIWPLTSRRILTLSWVDGVAVNDHKKLDAMGIDRKRLAVHVLQSFLRQALFNGFFHADMHQGNILVRPDGKMVLIDFGIMGRLDALARRTFAEIIYGFSIRDYQRTAKAHFNAGYVPAHHSVEQFAQALRAVGEPLYGKNANLMDMSKVMQQLFDVTDLFDMHLRPELVLLQRTMVIVEGVARGLDPEINLWDSATPVVKEYVAEEVGPRRQLERLREATEKALDVAPHLPRYLEQIGEASARVSTDRFGLSQHTTEELAKALSREGRMTRAALLFAGSAALVLVAAMALT